MIKILIRTCFSLLLLSNCATVQTLPKSLDQDNPAIFSGVYTVWLDPSKTKGLLFDYDEMAGIVTLVVYTLDTPFSFLADTILLPITIPVAIGKRVIYSNSNNDPHLESSWSKHRGNGYINDAKKICEELGMRLPSSSELEIAKSSGFMQKWSKCSYCNNVFLFEDQNTPVKSDFFGSIRCLRKGKFY